MIVVEIRRIFEVVGFDRVVPQAEKHGFNEPGFSGTFYVTACDSLPEAYAEGQSEPAAIVDCLGRPRLHAVPLTICYSIGFHIMKPTTALREKMNNGTVSSIGAIDGLSARLVEQAGFDSVYVGSYATEASMFGKPDLAMMSKSDRLWVARNIAKAVDIPVVCDAEEGWGTAINVMEAVRDFEAAGVAAIHLDDEQIPSKCPFLPGIPRNQLISADEMCGKIEAAVDARRDPDFQVFARTDVIGTMPLEQYYRENKTEEVVNRLNAYLEAGADAAFVMALTQEEVDYYRKRIQGPLVGIFATIEPLAISVFEQANYQLVIGSLVGIYAAAKGLQDAYRKLKETGDWNAIQDKLIDDERFFEIVGLDQYRDYYHKYRIC
jgi:2-methylisocitrate lyase-like PEP mutase family enzyme